jgi:hypothetical protein
MAWVGWEGVALGAGIFACVVALLIFWHVEKAQQPRSPRQQQFWTLYAINERLYNKLNQKRLHWSEQRFKHHPFRWQSRP